MKDIQKNITDKKKQIQEGRKWVEDQIHRFAEKFQIEIKGLEWGEDFKRDQQLLALVLDKKRGIEKFSDEDIMDIPGTPHLREEILPRLETFVKKFTAS